MNTTQAQRVGPYALGRLLGEGGYARVFLAQDTERGIAVALKMMKPEVLTHDKARPRFHREAKALMAIEHDNIISLFDYSGADAPQPFIAMEKLSGRTLDALVAERGALPSPIAAIIFAQVAAGMQAAHAAALLHRDLSLANLFIEDSGRVVVMDFGLAAAVQGRRDSQTFVTRGQGLVGTPLFYAPEILHDQPYHAGSDLYAVGVAMTYVLLGRPPAPTSDISELLGAILEGRLLRVEDELPETDKRLVATLHALLEPDPKQRWSDAGQLLNALTAIQPEDPRAVLARWLDAQAATRIVALQAHERTIVRAAESGDIASAIKVASSGRYQLGELLGEGGMGRVFRAQDTTREQAVAIKVLHQQNEATTGEERLRFHREARALARLRHPNIVRLIDYSGRDAPLPYLVLELIEGATLQAVITLKPIDEAVTLQIALKLTEALAAAHEAGIVHRDLKPDNVFIDTAGRVVLTDFGIARGIEREGTFAVRGTKAIGTPQFASPEQMLTPDRVGPASDLFSLGSLLVALLVGGPPIDSDNLVTVMEAMQKGVFRPLPQTAGKDLRALIERLHAQDPLARPASASRVADELEKMLAARRVVDADVGLRAFFGIEEATRAHLTVAHPTVARRAPSRPAPRRWARAVAFASIVVVVGSATAVFLLRPSETPEPQDLPVAIQPLPTPPPAPEAPLPTPPPAPPVALPTPAPLPNVPLPAALPERPVTEKPLIEKARVPSKPATLRFITKPWANISIDGRAIGATPIVNTTELAPGPHALRFEHPGFATIEQKVELKNGEVREIRVTLNK